MYISLRDRPQAPVTPARGRPRVARVVVMLGFVSLLTDISSESVAAILPLYLTTVLGLSTLAYGLVDGLYQGVSALVRVLAGMVADRTDQPKWVAFFGYGLSCVARVFLLLADTVAAITGVVTADRIGKGVRTAPRDAMIAAATPTSDLGRAFGVHRTLDTIGAAVGPLLAFLILWLIPDGYRTVMVVSLASAVMGVALLGLLVPNRRRRPVLEPVAVRIRWREIADPRLLRLLVVAGGLGLLTVGDGFIYLALLDRSQFAVAWFPLLYVGTNVVYLCLAIPIGRLADRVGRARVLVCGHLALAAAYGCVLLPGTGAGPVVASLLSLGVFYAATDGVTAAVAGRLVGPQVRASGIAAAQTVVAVARLFASAAFGALWFVLGPQAALLVVGILLMGAIPLAYPVMTRLDREADLT